MVISVTLVTQPGCSSCDHAKAVLGRLSDEFPLEIRAIDVNDDHGRELAQKSGLAFAPGVFLDGQLFSHGRLSERKLRRHLTSAS